jgi:hypothetical protein
MTDERYRELEESDDATLTEEEIKEGWHWCSECDYLLTNSCCLDGKIDDNSEIIF